MFWWAYSLLKEYSRLPIVGKVDNVVIIGSISLFLYFTEYLTFTQSSGIIVILFVLRTPLLAYPYLYVYNKLYFKINTSLFKNKIYFKLPRKKGKIRMSKKKENWFTTYFTDAIIIDYVVYIDKMLETDIWDKEVERNFTTKDYSMTYLEGVTDFINSIEKNDTIEEINRRFILFSLRCI